MTFWQVLRAEAGRVFSDVALVLTVIGGVLLYSFFYPQPYAKGVVSELKISVVDQDRSAASRRIVFDLDASPLLNVFRRDLTEDDAQAALEAGEIKGIVVIPEHFEREVKLGRRPVIALGADAGYFLIFGGIIEGAMETILTNSARLKVAAELDTFKTVPGEGVHYTSFILQTSPLFNAQNSYVQYVVPAVFVLILQQTMLIGLGILGGGIDEARRRREKGYWDAAPVWMLMMSRVLIFGTLYTVHFLYYFGFSLAFFGVTQLAAPVDLITFAVPFLLAVIFLGIAFGALIRERELATPIVLFTSLPLVFSAGFVWPLEAVPGFVILAAVFIPSTPGIEGFVAMNQMGASFSEILPHYALLWLQTLFYGVAAYFLLQRQRKRAIRTMPGR